MSAIEILCAILQKMSTTKICYAENGGNKVTRHLIKLVSFFSLTDMNFCRCNLDSDSCLGTNDKSDEDIDHITR